MKVTLDGKWRLPIGEWDIARQIQYPSDVWVDLGPRPAPPKTRNHPVYLGERYDAENDIFWLPDATGAASIPAIHSPHALTERGGAHAFPHLAER